MLLGESKGNIGKEKDPVKHLSQSFSAKKWLLVLIYLRKSSVIDVSLGPKYPSSFVTIGMSSRQEIQ